MRGFYMKKTKKVVSKKASKTKDRRKGGLDEIYKRLVARKILPDRRKESRG